MFYFLLSTQLMFDLGLRSSTVSFINEFEDLILIDVQKEGYAAEEE